MSTTLRCRSAPRRIRARRGFTLLELILAMSLAAMLSVTMYASMTIAYRARRTAEAAVQPIRAATMAIDLVGQDLQSVLPPNGILRGPFVGTQQAGNGATRADIVDFYCLGEDAPPAEQTNPLDQGMRQVELAVRTDVDPPVLVRRVTRNLLSTNQVAPDEEVLCRGVRSLTLRYSDGTAWYDAWDSTKVEDTLPVAIEMTLEVQKDPSRPVAQAAPAPVGQATASDVYRITRVMLMGCAQPVDASEADMSSSGTSSGGSQ